jgi:hypothetical protein
VKRSLIAAALLATALAGVGGPSPASATTLCTTNTSPCSGTSYLNGTMLKASSELVIFSGKGIVVDCAISFTNEVTMVGTPIKTTMTPVTFSACEGSCTTAKATDLPWEGKIKESGLGDGKGTLTISKGTSGPTVEFDNCLKSKTWCTFERMGTPMDWSFVGGTSPTIDAVFIVWIRSGGPAECGDTVTMQTKAPLTNPAGPIYVVK